MEAALRVVLAVALGYAKSGNLKLALCVGIPLGILSLAFFRK